MAQDKRWIVSDKVFLIPNLKDKDAFKTFISDKPLSWLCVLTLRMALRKFTVLPIGNARSKLRPSAHNNLLQPLCYANSIAFLVNLKNNWSDELKKAVAESDNSMDLAFSYYNTVQYNSVSVSADAIFQAATLCGIATKDSYKSAAFLAANIEKITFNKMLLSAFEGDILQLKLGVEPSDLIGFPLWKHEIPKIEKNNWIDLQESITINNPSWSYWIDWYEARLRGDQPDLELEEKIALLPRINKEGEPEKLNRQIIEIARKHHEDKFNAIKFDVFLSYSSKNLDKAKFVTTLLENHGLKVYAQFKDFKVGHDFALNMYEGLRFSKQTVSLLSNQYFDSLDCKREIATAQRIAKDEGNETLIPLLTEKISTRVMSSFANTVYVSLVDKDNVAQLILEALKLPFDATKVPQDLFWDTQEAHEQKQAEKGAVYSLGLNGEAMLVPLPHPALNSGFNVQDYARNILKTMQRFERFLLNLQGNAIYSRSFSELSQEALELLKAPYDQCDCLELNTILRNLLEKYLREKFHGNIAKNDDIDSQYENIRRAYIELGLAYPNIKLYRESMREDLFTEPTDEVQAAYRFINEQLSKNDDVVTDLLSKAFERALKSIDMTHEEQLEKLAKIEAHNGYFTRLLPLSNWLKNARTKLAKEIKNPEQLNAKIDAYEKLGDKINTSIDKIIEWALKSLG